MELFPSWCQKVNLGQDNSLGLNVKLNAIASLLHLYLLMLYSGFPPKGIPWSPLITSRVKRGLWALLNQCWRVNTHISQGPNMTRKPRCSVPCLCPVKDKDDIKKTNEFRETEVKTGTGLILNPIPAFYRMDIEPLLLSLQPTIMLAHGLRTHKEHGQLDSDNQRCPYASGKNNGSSLGAHGVGSFRLLESSSPTIKHRNQLLKSKETNRSMVDWEGIHLSS
ncbi:hypothetical protein H6P81_006166 [Aristolochia fimbriata]|uniref:Uncharacterized protein n=1 Tax=Aristolochia fimbriata TaxID=158543 RepID=A0AAV7EWP6_ARIFI|nr:hypothetical protein H6P81_006166 [Aristolochia fimbriata]